MTSPRTLLRAWGIHPRKQLGQNFLADPAMAEMIVRRSNLSQGDTILEIGSGLGALTIPLASAAKRVYAVEKDRQLARLLNNELLAKGISNVQLIEADILGVDLHQMASEANGPITVMGNLPYNISSQILVKLISERASINRAVLMFQRELSDRLTAHAGSRRYGRLTVMLAYCAKISAIAEVPNSVFFPRPRIDSRVIAVTFGTTPGFPAADERFLFNVIKAAFSKRRKTLKNALTQSQLPVDTDAIVPALHDTGIDPTRRAETLSVQEFVALSNRLYREIP